VRIICKGAITSFGAKHNDALEPLLHWYHVTKKAGWKNLAETQKDFRRPDHVERFTVLNIAGNKYRLIAVIKYRWQVVYVRHVLTHAEYSKEKWKS
jgi:mRNA interferase HigB